MVRVFGGLFVLLVMLTHSFIVFGQYDTVFAQLQIKTLLTSKIDSQNIRKTIWYAHDSNLVFRFYSAGKSIKCNYWWVNGKVITVPNVIKGAPGCELDITSFEAYKLRFNSRKYVIVTCINSGSGNYSRLVYCNLFDVTNPSTIRYNCMVSEYGSEKCFGDFNEDGILDFLAIKKGPKNPNLFVANLYSLSPSNGAFVLQKKNYLKFQRSYDRNNQLIITQ
jgi:hypothetical protein